MSVPSKAGTAPAAGHAMDDYASAAEIARLVRAREISPVKRVERSLARIAELNPTLTALPWSMRNVRWKQRGNSSVAWPMEKILDRWPVFRFPLRAALM